MPPLSEMEIQKQPEKNVTFTQFFNKLLIKVPQVDIEKLPIHLLGDMLHGQDQTNIEHQLLEDQKEEDEMENDIYSLEHQENVEEFRPKEKQFLPPIRVKSPAVKDSNISRMMLTEVEDNDKDSVTCTVEENDLNCHDDDILDLRLEDEFTEDNESNTLVDEVTIDHKESYEVEKTFKDRDNSKESKNILKDSESSRIFENLEKSSEVLGDNVTSENPNLDNPKHSSRNPEIVEIKDKEKNKSDIINVKKPTTCESVDFDQTSVEDFSSTESKTETGAEPRGGTYNKDIITSLKLIPAKEQSDFQCDTVSSVTHSQELTTHLELSEKEQTEVDESKKEHLKKNLEDEQENKDFDDEIQEVYPEDKSINTSPLKENMDMTRKVNDTKQCVTTKTDKKGRQVKPSIESTKIMDKNPDKGFKIDEDIEPPPLKIRIFKGHSGELINEKEAKRSRKRKKKTEKQKSKIAKLNSQIEQQTMLNAAEESTQNRIYQELPGCNWLEQKIKNGEGSQNKTSQLDALLETDSDDDCLVVDDQSEACEVTTSCNEVENKENDTRAEQTSKNSEKTTEPTDNPNTLPPQAKNAERDLTQMKESESQMKVNGNHPLTYMLGNLMKKMDAKHIERGPVGIDYGKLAKENKKRDYSGLEKTNNGSVLEENQISNSNTKPEEMKLYPQFKVQNDSKQTESANNMSLSDRNGLRFKRNKIYEASEKPSHAGFEQHPPELRKNTIPSSDSLKMKTSYERTVEESRAARQNAQNLYFREQMKEKKRLEDQLLKDIEDLKNKKIKEMEDLIEIKTKKEQTMTDLEKLKLEIEKNKTFLESLKKINLREEIKISPHSSVQQEEDKSARMKVAAIPGAHQRHPQAEAAIEKQLPDLVNHEKIIPNENNDKQQQFVPETLQYSNISQEYIMHLQRMNEKNSTAAQLNIPERTPPPQTLPKQVVLNQNQVAGPPDNQIYVSNNLRPQSLPNNMQTQNQQQQVPMLLPNPPPSKLSKYGTNIQNFFPGLENTREKEDNEKLNQKVSHPRGIIRMQSDSGIPRGPPLVKEHNMDGKNVQNKVPGEGFIRPRAFSREENITPPSELSKLMTNMNSHYAVRNNITGQTQYIQPRQDITAKRNFPEIRNAIAASTERRLSQPTVGTPTPTAPSQTAQPREPASVLSKCAVCTRVANFLCSGCQSVYYCTVQCQSKHWLVHYNKCVGARS